MVTGKQCHHGCSTQGCVSMHFHRDNATLGGRHHAPPPPLPLSALHTCARLTSSRTTLVFPTRTLTLKPSNDSPAALQLCEGPLKLSGESPLGSGLVFLLWLPGLALPLPVPQPPGSLANPGLPIPTLLPAVLAGLEGSPPMFLPAGRSPSLKL